MPMTDGDGSGRRWLPGRETVTELSRVFSVREYREIMIRRNF